MRPAVALAAALRLHVEDAFLLLRLAQPVVYLIKGKYVAGGVGDERGGETQT